MVPIDDRIRVMIHDNAGEHEIKKYVLSLYPGIDRNAGDKVLQGKTSIEEMVRVIRDN